VKLVFMGSPDFAVPCLDAVVAAGHEVVLVVTQPDKPAGRGGHLNEPAVKRAAARLGLPIAQPRSMRTPEIAATLAATGAELGVVVAYGKILPPAVLAAFPRGCINVHGSILPAYRGAAPIQWAVIEGCAETGVTIMQLDQGMDTGPMLLERRTAIGADETAGELFARLAPLGAAALVEAIAALAAGTSIATPQPSTGASHARMLSKDDGAVDFARPAARVAAHVRGVDPWPGAVASLGGAVAKLFGARARAGAVTAAPGTVVAIDDDGAHVACADGVVVIRELQLPGGKRLRARDLANGRRLAVGDLLARPAAT
jgi:methionyl-tRNA formyltransferase